MYVCTEVGRFYNHTWNLINTSLNVTAAISYMGMKFSTRVWYMHKKSTSAFKDGFTLCRRYSISRYYVLSNYICMDTFQIHLCSYFQNTFVCILSHYIGMHTFTIHLYAYFQNTFVCILSQYICMHTFTIH
jgi:hypothetical protein